MLDNYKFDFKLYKNILGKICHKTKMLVSYLSPNDIKIELNRCAIA